MLPQKPILSKGMEMRSVSFFLVTFTVLFSVVVALPTFSFSGSTQLDQPNVGVYGGIYLDGLPCYIDDDVGYFEHNYVAWNIFIDASNASYYFVRAHATNQTANDDPEFSLYIYTSFDPTNPCQGLYGNGQFVEGYVEGIKILDGVNLVAGSYIIVATTDDGEEAVFGIEFSPATTIVPIQPGLGLPFYSEDAGPAYYDSSSFSNNCSYDEEDDQYIYNNFSWTASTSGYFDIYAIVINSTFINPYTFDDTHVYLSLYSGSIASVDIFQANPCQSNFINGYFEGRIVSALDYIWLNAGSDYTLVVSIEEIYGSVAIQVVPSNFFFLNNASFFALGYFSTVEDCSPTDEPTSWVSLTVTAWYPVFVVADVQPINTDYWGYFDYSFYLYDGNLNGNPPIACTGLIQIDSYSLGGQFTIGSNYTIILIDEEFNHPSLPYLNSASHLFVLTGPYINTASFAVLPSSTGSLATSSSSSSTSSTSSSTFSSSSSVSTATSASSVATVSSSSTVSVSGSTGIVSGTSTSAKPTTGIKATTGVAGSSTATGSNGNASDASHPFVSMFVFLLLIFALSF